MFIKVFTLILALFFTSFSNLFAETIKQAVIESINTNPALKEKLRNYRAVQQNLNIVESEYYPSIDLKASFGINSASGFIDDLNISKDDSYNNYQASITLTQNIFNGFATTNMIDYEEARILVAAYQYIEKSNEITFNMVKSYLNVLRFHELLKVAVKNVQLNEITYKKIEDLFESGLITLSEIKKIESVLSLSKSNLVMQLTKARDAKFRYRRVVGRMPNLSAMRKPDYRINIPKSSQSASLYAINHNPSLLVNRYMTKSFQALRKRNKKGFFPTLDLEITQNYNDANQENIYDYPDDRFQARLVFNYNIFKGGADSAKAQKYISLTNKEIERGRELKRKIIEDVDIAWNIYDMSKEQLKDLREYKIFSEEAFNLYQDEFSQGSRSLVELLLVQKDLIDAEFSVIDAEYASLVAKYRILNATGLLFSRIVGDREFASRVNLFTDNEVHTTLDTDLVRLDVDSDNISDNRDLCDNSILENNIMPYGCKKIAKFSSEMKEIIEYKKDNRVVVPKVKKVKPKKKISKKKVFTAKKRELTPKKKSKKKVKKKVVIEKSSFIEENSISRPDIYAGSFIEENSISSTANMYGLGDLEKGNGDIDVPDGCFDVPTDYITDSDGCANSVVITLSKGFEKIDRAISHSVEMKIFELSTFLKKNPNIMAHIVGYSSRTAVSNYNYNLKISKQRAQRFKNELIKSDIFSYRLTVDGKGYRN
ncbi:MAG: TolC family protein, partial [Campylobacterota bacterium]|nr:TolC family protein [Campylobacterota bacterium]